MLSDYRHVYNFHTALFLEFPLVISFQALLRSSFRVRYLVSHPYTYLLTPWSRALLEKLTGFAASQEIPRIFGTRMFIIVLTSARHLSLS